MEQRLQPLYKERGFPNCIHSLPTSSAEYIPFHKGPCKWKYLENVHSRIKCYIKTVQLAW